MSASKERLTVTVDPDLVEAGNRAVAAGRSDSLSAWVNEALRARTVRDPRLAALADAIADYEAGHGKITAQEIAARERRDRETAGVVRGPTQQPPDLRHAADR